MPFINVVEDEIHYQSVGEDIIHVVNLRPHETREIHSIKCHINLLGKGGSQEAVIEHSTKGNLSTLKWPTSHNCVITNIFSECLNFI